MNENKEIQETKEKDMDWWIPLFSAFLMSSGNSQSNIELEKKVSYLEGRVDTLEKMLLS